MGESRPSPDGQIRVCPLRNAYRNFDGESRMGHRQFYGRSSAEDEDRGLLPEGPTGGLLSLFALALDTPVVCSLVACQLAHRLLETAYGLAQGTSHIGNLARSENDQGNHEDDYQMSRLKKTFEHDRTPLYLFDDIPQYSTLTL